MKTKTYNFSFSEFMAFSESLTDSLEAISEKVVELTDQLNTLENVIEGDGNTEEAPVAAEENVDIGAENDIPAEDGGIDAPVEESAEGDIPTEEVVSEEEVVSDETPAEESTPEEDNDAAAIDAMSTGDENFSDKYLVVGLKNRPWGNRVIKEKQFSETEHRKLIPTSFSTQAQAQRALTSYNITGENFSIRYNHVKNMLNM